MEKTKHSRIPPRAVFACLTLLWMLLIFSMSARNADESRDQSSTVCEIICEAVVKDYDRLPPARQIALQQRLSFPVRKGAHLTEYIVLGALLTLTVSAGRSGRDLPSLRDRMASALPAGALYAVTDELHQIFVPGRSGELRDVLIDSAGVFLGICAVHLLVLWRAGKAGGGTRKLTH